VSPVRYDLGYVPEDGTVHSHRREDFKSYVMLFRCISITVTVAIPNYDADSIDSIILDTENPHIRGAVYQQSINIAYCLRCKMGQRTGPTKRYAD
jgi:hypothetical protein